MYNWKNPQGLALKVYSAVRSFFEDSKNYRVMVQVLLGLTLLGCGALLAYTVRFRKKPFPIAFPRLAHGVPVVLALFIAVFGITGCDIPLLGDSDIAGINYFHPNHLGSVKLITDNTGAVIADYKYAPYGELLREYSSNTSASKYKYTGQEEDEETGLYYYKARYYDSSVGRFVSADSVIPGMHLTQAFNRYAYVMGNPINGIDPSGHSPLDKLFDKIIKKAIVQVLTAPVRAAVYIANKAANAIQKGASYIDGKLDKFNESLQKKIDKFMAAQDRFIRDTIGNGDWWEKQWDDWGRTTLCIIAITAIVVIAAVLAAGSAGALTPLSLGIIAGTFAVSGALIGGTKGEILKHPFDPDTYKDFHWGYAIIGAAVGGILGYNIAYACTFSLWGNAIIGLLDFSSFVLCGISVMNNGNWEPLPLSIYREWRESCNGTYTGGY
jgi:RHS repeat-associated protein